MNKKLPVLMMIAMGFQSSLAIHFRNPDEMLSYVKRFLPQSPVILEAGGNHGEDTNRMKSVWSNAVMHVFEPLPDSFEVVLKNTKSLSDVFCYPYALTNYSGETDFYIDFHNHGSSSINYPVKFNEHEFEKTPIRVSCITIDEWAKQNNVDSIDFMWLDMESHELYALRHALDILKTVKAIYTEVAYEPVRQGSCLYPELRAFLEAQGFVEVWKVSHGRFGDALFIKKELMK